LKLYMTSLLRRGWPDLDEIWYPNAGTARRLLQYGRRCNQKKNSNMADVCFFKPEVVISQP